MFGIYTGPQPPQKPFNELNQEEQADLGARKMIEFMQSCPGKTVMSGVMGFGMGAFFGLFMASMAYDVPIGTSPNSTISHISQLPFKQQMKLQFTDMYKRSASSAKNFGFIGLIYSGVECSIESLRAKHDIVNGVSSGCITGAALSYKAGPQAAAFGCLGFAAFSAAIDMYMESEARAPPRNDYDD
ncbi:Tim17/Tim22/Tim23/Pmp24 family-domain-containing protein [Scheffersomyces coipomensis]|uniref:Tim17/Tim22/Tim23/Pmp24 family-domain-containing protein n=1 Tax=Scheffersomyces coipomensis TaxID=1788519 RepID=UPI00315C65A5